MLSRRSLENDLLKNFSPIRRVDMEDGVLGKANNDGTIDINKKVVKVIFFIRLDIKGLNTLVMALPRREIEQTIGRITRDPNSPVRPLVIDITDDLESFVRQSYVRRKYYRTNGFQIKYYEVDENEIVFKNILSKQTLYININDFHKIVSSIKQLIQILELNKKLPLYIVCQNKGSENFGENESCNLKFNHLQALNKYDFWLKFDWLILNRDIRF